MRRWIKLIAALAVLALMLAICAAMGKMLLSMLNIMKNDGGETLPDPMFAEKAEMVTRPPELDEEGVYIHEDHSDEWIIENHTPVDKTAEELAREAETPG